MSIKAMKSLEGMDAPQYNSGIFLFGGLGITSASVAKAKICQRLCVYGLSQKKKKPAVMDMVMIDL